MGSWYQTKVACVGLVRWILYCQLQTMLPYDRYLHEAANLSQLKICTKASWAVSSAAWPGEEGLVTSSVVPAKIIPTQESLSREKINVSLKKHDQQQCLRDRDWSLREFDHKSWETLKKSCTRVWIWCLSFTLPADVYPNPINCCLRRDQRVQESLRFLWPRAGF